jgi:hypothetical protein
VMSYSMASCSCADGVTCSLIFAVAMDLLRTPIRNSYS